MQAGTIGMMIVMLGIVWGGFALLLWRSARIDRQRRGR